MSGLSILIPVFNERATVEEAIDRVLAAELPLERVELVVVDDGSTDGTSDVLAGREWPERVRILRHASNRGKGAAVRTALEQARGEYAVIMDADLEYDPGDLAAIVEPLLGGEAEAVFGTRAFEAHTAYSFWYVLGNKAVTFTCNLLYNCWLSDIMTCHKAMPTELFRSLGLREDGFAIEPEITARLVQRGVRIHEIPVVYAARGREEGKKLTARDGVRVLSALIRCRLSRPARPHPRAGA